MKKLLFLIGIMVLLVTSCKKNEPVPPPVPPPVEDPAPPPAPTPTTTTTTTTIIKEEEKEPDGTSISINKDGVRFESKDGQNENKVNVSTKKDAEVEIKRKN